MSVTLMTLVKKYGPADRTDFQVLHSLADHAGNDGDHCWISEKAIAIEERIGLRTVERSILNLERDGWFVATRRSRKHKGTSYQLNLAMLTKESAEARNKAKSTVMVAGEERKNGKSPAKCDQSHPPNLQSHPPNETKSPAKCDFPLIGTIREPSGEPSCEPSFLAPSPKKPGLDAGSFANTSRPEWFADGLEFGAPFYAEDGELYSDVFWWAECYLPELFAEAPCERDFALYATWTREEFEEWVIQAAFQIEDSNTHRTVTAVVTANQQIISVGRHDETTAKPRNAVATQEADDSTKPSNKRGRRHDADKPDGLRKHAHSR